MKEQIKGIIGLIASSWQIQTGLGVAIVVISLAFLTGTVQVRIPFLGVEVETKVESLEGVVDSLGLDDTANVRLEVE